jgi:hypothetical protein
MDTKCIKNNLKRRKRKPSISLGNIIPAVPYRDDCTAGDMYVNHNVSALF